MGSWTSGLDRALHSHPYMAGRLVKLKLCASVERNLSRGVQALMQRETEELSR